jgi:2-oxoisovalerate dehydrogenase E1 component
MCCLEALNPLCYSQPAKNDYINEEIMPDTSRTNLLTMYEHMYKARHAEMRLGELYRQGVVKGTVTTGEGNEATIVGAASALNPQTDIANFMQRDFAGYLVWGVSLYHLFSHYMANRDSSTEGKDGNVHHGIPTRGLLPMVSHLGSMLPNVVGAVHGRRKQGIDSVGLAIIGDGGTSTGDFHEAINIASVLDIPVLFLIENNQWAYSTPNSRQFRCEDLSTRAAGYGIQGERIHGTDVADVYARVQVIIDEMRENPAPFILQSDTYRLTGHAAYDMAEYVPKDELAKWREEDPVPVARARIICEGLSSDKQLIDLESRWDEEISAEANSALGAPKIDPKLVSWATFSTSDDVIPLAKVSAKSLTAIQAVNRALDVALEHDPKVMLIGEDIGSFGGPFKATKGLFAKYGRGRVLDMPIAESGFTGFALGAAVMGMRPVVEMQFSDFSTDATTQIGINAGTFFFRTGHPLPLTIRMPGGGGLSYGPFHSEDLEGLFGTFPGLKIVYPSFVQDYFSLLLASIFDDNPVLFFESKFLQRRLKDDIEFGGVVPALDGARIVKPGNDLTICAYGAPLHDALEAVEIVEEKAGVKIEVVDPRILKPFDRDTLVESVSRTHRFLMIHESWQACGMGAWFITSILKDVFFELDAPPLLYAPEDTPVPFAPELEAIYRPDVTGIVQKIDEVLAY